MKIVKSILKASALIGVGYGAAQLNQGKKVNLKETFDAKSEKLLQYLSENGFQYPKIYDHYLNLKDADHFLEKLILKDSDGLSHYKIFLPEDFINSLFKDHSHFSVEERIKYSKIACVFTAGTSVQSHSQIVHGGFQATMIDNLFGYLGTLANELKPCATATLSINYKKPVRVGEEYIIKVHVDKIEGRKVYLSARVEDTHGVLHTESTALMISVNWGTSSWKKMFNTLQTVTNLTTSSANPITSPAVVSQSTVKAAAAATE